jgi:hypothetical protein
MQPPIPDVQQHSAARGLTVRYEIEAHLRAAGRGLEWAGVTDPEAARLANVVFRLASRVRGDRLGRAA